MQARHALAALAVVATAGFAGAQCNIDQDQPNAFVYMAAFNQTDLAQSFQTTQSSICGAEIFLQAGIGTTDTVTIELWDALPNAGGNMLTSGSAIGNQGTWCAVSWASYPITPNTTYYLVFTGNFSLGISGDVNDPYPFGEVYANSGYGMFPFYDYTFRTLSGPSCTSGTTYCTAGTTTNGCVPSIGGSGSPIVGNSSGYTISVANVEGQKSGIIFYGIDNSGFTATPWALGSTSFLCVKAPTQRMTTQATGGTAGQCNGALSIDWLAYMAAQPGALGQPIAAGQQFWGQAWFRDPPAPKTTNLSDGLTWTVCP